jgi:hypothetical protein
MPLSKVDLYAAIRRDARGGMSGRAIALNYQISRRTVRAALTSAWPTPRKPMPRRASKLDPFKPTKSPGYGAWAWGWLVRWWGPRVAVRMAVLESRCNCQPPSWTAV